MYKVTLFHFTEESMIKKFKCSLEGMNKILQGAILMEFCSMKFLFTIVMGSGESHLNQFTVLDKKGEKTISSS